MTIVEIAQTLRSAWDVLFPVKLEAPEEPSRFVLHLEAEVERLRGENARLQIRLEQALTPAPVVVPQVVKRDFSDYKPIKTSWEQYVEQEVSRQELEAQEAQLQEK